MRHMSWVLLSLFLSCWAFPRSWKIAGYARSPPRVVEGCGNSDKCCVQSTRDYFDRLRMRTGSQAYRTYLDYPVESLQAEIDRGTESRTIQIFGFVMTIWRTRICSYKCADTRPDEMLAMEVNPRRLIRQDFTLICLNHQVIAVYWERSRFDQAIYSRANHLKCLCVERPTDWAQEVIRPSISTSTLEARTTVRPSEGDCLDFPRADSHLEAVAAAQTLTLLASTSTESTEDDTLILSQHGIWIEVRDQQTRQIRRGSGSGILWTGADADHTFEACTVAPQDLELELSVHIAISREQSPTDNAP